MKITRTDQCGREVIMPVRPCRIISLVPSQTELLDFLGLADRVVGITRFCTHPDNWHKTKSRVGGTKDFDPEKIRSLQPDLILANKEENDRKALEYLAQDFPVWISDIRHFEQAIGMIEAIGAITQCEARAQALVQQIRHQVPVCPPQEKRIAYLIWKNPYMTVNHDTFIHDMIARAGYVNVFGEKTESRYPEVSVEELIAAAPDEIWLSSEPFPFRDKHMEELRALNPDTMVRLTDGRNWSWYGSALLDFDSGK